MLEIITKTKYCHCCKKEKDSLSFYRDKNRKDGLQPQCKECLKLYASLNKDKRMMYQIEYQLKNRVELAKKQRTYQLSQKGKAVQRNSNHKRRSKIKNGDIDTNNLMSLQQSAKTCYWCKCSLKNVKVHIDHYYPIAKGGNHTIDNLVISCQKCNQKKHTKDPTLFANSIGRLL